jgi:hypothetical protein
MRKPAFPAILPEGVQLEALAASLQPFDGAEPEPAINFEPVPRKRNRRSGWTAKRQRAFIAALARCGSVRVACRHVGLSSRTVYRLLRMEGAESFADAWDEAAELGRARLEADALERAINGAFVPVYRKGRLVRVEYRRCDRLAIAMLGGRDRDIANTGWAYRRVKSHAMWREDDERKAAEEREKAEFAKRYEEDLRAMIEKGRAARQPRIRTL